MLPLLYHILDLGIHVESDHAPNSHKSLESFHEPGYPLDPLSRRGEYPFPLAQVISNALVRDKSPREAGLLELHRGTIEDEVCEPKAVSAIEIVLPHALVDDVEQRSQRIERGPLRGIGREFDLCDGVVLGKDEIGGIVCEQGGEDGRSAALDDRCAAGDFINLKLQLHIGPFALRELDGDYGVLVKGLCFVGLDGDNRKGANEGVRGTDQGQKLGK